jgi:hypothetical protein
MNTVKFITVMTESFLCTLEGKKLSSNGRIQFLLVILVKIQAFWVVNQFDS